METNSHIEDETREASPASEGDTEDVLSLLGRIDLLRALPAAEVQALVPYLRPVRFSANEKIITEGEEGDALYFIDTGEARVQSEETQETKRLGAGDIVGEMALLSDDKRTASVFAATDISALKLEKSDFDRIVDASPRFKHALEDVAEKRRRGITLSAPSRQFWVATALRAVEARYRGITGWQAALIAGMAVWAGLILNAHFRFFSLEPYPSQKAVLELIAGLMILQGACEAFVTGVERMGARLGWDGFISGTIASLLSTIPEFVVIAFLVQIDPLAAFVTAVVTIFNNALIFSVYSFFLPKDRAGVFAMPRSVTMAGGELLIAGCAISLITGIVMLVLRINDTAAVLKGWDLIVVGAVLLMIYFYYLLTLVKYYGEGKNTDENDESHPPDPDSLGHDTSWFGIISMMFLGVLGAYAGGESIGGFAETAIGSLGLPTIPTAAALAFFAGVSEYIIVYKSHRRGELGIALSNVFGGLSQVMFMLVPCGMILIGGLGLYTGKLHFGIPINEATILLIFLLFPLFYTLHQFIEQEKALSDLDAAAMTGIYLLLLYFLFTAAR